MLFITKNVHKCLENFKQIIWIIKYLFFSHFFEDIILHVVMKITLKKKIQYQIQS